MLIQLMTSINAIELRNKLILYVIVLSVPGAGAPGAVGIQTLRQPTI